MPTQDLDLPDHFPFKTLIDSRSQDFDSRGRLTSQALFLLMNEARVKFYLSLGYQGEELDGTGTALVNSITIHEAACAPGDVLASELAVGSFSPTSYDLFYRARSARTGDIVAKARTTIGFVDPSTGRPIKVPEAFRERCT